MSEYIVQRDSLVNVADEIRVLSGTTEELGLEEMASNVADANDTIDAQATTISEIAALLEGKSVPGGSGGSVETCTVTLRAKDTTYYATAYAYTFLDESGNISAAYVGNNTNIDVTINNVVRGSLFAFYQSSGVPSCQVTNCSLLNYGGFSNVHINCSAGETADIYIANTGK